jgi:hypothetical protein
MRTRAPHGRTQQPVAAVARHMALPVPACLLGGLLDAWGPRARSGMRKTASASRAIYPSIAAVPYARDDRPSARGRSFAAKALDPAESMQMQVPLRPNPTGDVRMYVRACTAHQGLTSACRRLLLLQALHFNFNKAVFCEASVQTAPTQFNTVARSCFNLEPGEENGGVVKQVKPKF